VTTATPPVSEPIAPPQASGDPHLTNTRGEKFDIYKSGQMEFLRVPYECVRNGPDGCGTNFTVLATIAGVSESIKDCGRNRYITSLRFVGDWLRDRQLDVEMRQGKMVVLLGGDQLEPSLGVLRVKGQAKADGAITSEKKMISEVSFRARAQEPAGLGPK